MWTYAGALSIDPWKLTLGQLIAAYEAKQQADWDHTAAMLSSWSGKRISNPYRKPEKRYMKPEELYAMAKAIDARKR